MTIASLIGFMVAAQFVSLEALEIPYYVALLGAGSLAIHSRRSQSGDLSADDRAQHASGAVPTNVAGSPGEVETALPAPVDSKNSEPRFMNREFAEPEQEVRPTCVPVDAADWRDTIESNAQLVMN